MHRHPLRQALRLPQAALKRLVTGLLQLVLLANRPARLARSGFVLPTTVLLVLMVVLTTTALTYRSFTRSDMAISQREQQVIANAATPAIDRAKAKIEFLFRNDPRFPSGVPASDILSDLMATKIVAANTYVGSTQRVSPLGSGPTQDPHSPYTLPDETRVDINNDNKPDNAWSFKADINGDGVVGNDELVVYSILVDDEATPPSKPTVVKKIDSLVDRDKALALVTRTGPLATTEASPACAGALAEAGWQVVTQGNNSTLQKNFQVNAFVANANAANRTFETLEFQQSRIASRANRWGAWFRYDLAISPGQPFNWNGAMHTDGSLFADNSNYRAHMISSPSSCLYTKEASTITVGEVDLDGDEVANPRFSRTVDGQVQKEFQGQIVRGSLPKNVYEEPDVPEPEIHYWDGPGVPPVMGAKLTAQTGGNKTHSVDTKGKPFDIAMNPLRLFTNDVTEHIDPGEWARNGDWNNVDFRKSDRTLNEIVARPFVDDFFRADNRWGPKPRYDTRDANLDITTLATTTIGDPITGANVKSKLTNSEDGLDGYWERQAVRRGLRMIVGQRLELGNAFGWGVNPTTNATTPATEALYPASRKPAAASLAGATEKFGGNHEYLQRKSLRDNLAAVQGMVVYHYDKHKGEFPAACMAMTAHPGTPQSIVNSRTFNYYPNATSFLRADFLNGVGTNGWEFQFPAEFNTPGDFGTEVGSTKSLGIALRNLANFAGDPSGGAPSFKPFQDDFVHPDPHLSMWGDFSPLRRVLLSLDSGTTYADLSPADQATLHSAACTMSMLAYNVKSLSAEYKATIEDFNPPSGLNNVLNQTATKVIDEITDFMNPSSSMNTSKRNEVKAVLNRVPSRGGAPWSWTDVNTATVVIDPLPVADGGKGAICPASPAVGHDIAGFQPKCDSAELFSTFKFEDWVFLLEEFVPSLKGGDIDALLKTKKQLNEINSLLRDRDLGFRDQISDEVYNDITPKGNAVKWDGSNTEAVNPQGSAGPYVYASSCNPNIFSKLVAGGGGGKARVVMGALVACSEQIDNKMPVKYPSLFYLFPLINHDLVGTSHYAQPGGGRTLADGTTPVPGDSQYVVQATAYETDYIVKERSLPKLSFKVVGSTARDGLDEIAAEPSIATWTLPVEEVTGALEIGNINDTNRAFRVNWQKKASDGTVSASVRRVPFLDKGIFDGREQLNTRVLDIDVETLTKKKFGTGDFWLPANKEKQAEGVVYAFREDAVREDEIVRPKASSTTTSATCSGFASGKFKVEDDDNCQMKFNGLASAQDPPLTPDLISLKPVDFIADPQRRAHGFRLRTASGDPADFSGGNLAEFPNGRRVGMTFVTDNSVYIQGDFNLHSSDGKVGSLLEEFTETLNDKDIGDAFDFTKPGSFYKRTTLNLTQFANLAVDHWRPVEILADSLTILSENFKDGSVIDTFTKPEPSSVGGADSSYMNQNRPRSSYPDPANLIRTSAPNSPVWIDRDGTYYIRDGATVKPFYNVYTNTAGTPAGNDWMQFATGDATRRRNTQPAAKTYVNALFVSGIVPQRPKQTYGGLHNYPRLLESWSSQDLFISGAFIQLNFSTSATGPYEHDAWEAKAEPQDDLNIGYYSAPIRRWGYDVGLLYVPPAPAARRFVSIGAPRSEYYRELPADDPYILNLRCAKVNSTTHVFTNEGVRGGCET